MTGDIDVGFVLLFSVGSILGVLLLMLLRTCFPPSKVVEGNSNTQLRGPATLETSRTSHAEEGEEPLHKPPKSATTSVNAPLDGSRASGSREKTRSRRAMKED